MNSNISITGNLGKDPEIKYSKDGKGVCSISIAITPRFRSGDTWVDSQPIWYKSTFFGAKAEQVVETYKRGERVKITGQLILGQPWTDKHGAHHDGGMEISNAEIESTPWEFKKGAVESGSLAPAPAQEVLPQSEEAPF